MASVVDICNIALSNIRAGSINSLTEGSLGAQQCNLKYQLIVDFMIRDHPWTFARKKIAMAELTDDLFDWVYSYQYPSDCLMINRLMSAETKVSTVDGLAYRPDYYNNDPLLNNYDKLKSIEYAIENSSGVKVIGCDLPQAYIDYRVRITNPNLFDSNFIIALSWYLASELAIPIVGGDAGRVFRGEALSVYQNVLATAKSQNGNEQKKHSVAESDFILARR